MQEEKRCLSAHFITLTYDTDHVPITDNGFMSVSKRDVQLFLKRLRKITTAPIKYYCAAEYGGQTNRPHYHIILFNAAYDAVEKTWGLGEVHTGIVTGASIGYTLKYISKPKRIPMHRNDDRVPEFSLMSKGLGADYITDATRRFHTATDDRVFCTLEGGKKISMPRYYKDKIFSEAQRERIARAGLLLNSDRIENATPDEQQHHNQRVLAAFKNAAKSSNSPSKNQL